MEVTGDTGIPRSVELESLGAALADVGLFTDLTVLGASDAGVFS